jgi:hypothetical protein
MAGLLVGGASQMVRSLYDISKSERRRRPFATGYATAFEVCFSLVALGLQIQGRGVCRASEPLLCLTSIRAGTRPVITYRIPAKRWVQTPLPTPPRNRPWRNLLGGPVVRAGMRAARHGTLAGWAPWA